MSNNGNTALLIGGSIIAWGGYFGYQRWQEQKLPDSPVAAESAEDRAEKIQAAFAATANVKDAEIEAFITGLQKAVVEGDATTLSEMISPSRMLDAVEATSSEKLPPMARTMLENQLGTQLIEFFDATIVETTIKRIDRDSEGNIVIYLRMIDHDRIMVKSRWWLFHDGDTLRWWDGEDLQLGLRLSTMMAAGVSAAASSGDSTNLERFIAVLSTLSEISFEDPVQVRAFTTELDALDLRGLPTSFKNLAIVSRAAASTALGDSEDALERLQTLDDGSLGRLDLPVRHFQQATAYVMLERWDEAAKAAQRFLDLLGDDAETFHLLGIAEYGRDDIQAAQAAFDAGIADDPLLSDNYSGFVMVCTDLEKIGERLRKAPEPSVLEAAANELLLGDDAESLTRLIEAATTAELEWDAKAWQASNVGD